MKAAEYVEPGKIEVVEKDIPEVSDGDVLVQVKVASICGTDLKIFRNGHFKIPQGDRRVLGHEVAGIVYQVGAGVESVKVGDHVSVTPNIGCGACKECLKGLNQMCPDYEAFGISLDGGFQEYMLVPRFAIERGNLFKLPNEVSLAEAALLEPISCCLSGQKKVSVGLGDTVLVMGAGPIGCFHVMLAKLSGASKVLISNSKAPRLEIAKKAGADVLIDLSKENLSEVVFRETQGAGVDVIITSVANTHVVEAATDLLARNGRINVFSGLGKLPLPTIDVNSLHYKAQTITGTTGSSNLDYVEVLKLKSAGLIDLEPMISARFSLEQINEAIEFASSGKGMKTVIEFD